MRCYRSGQTVWVVCANSPIPCRNWSRSRKPKKRLSRCSMTNCSCHLRWRSARNESMGTRIHRWRMLCRSSTHKCFLVWSGPDSRRPCPARHREHRCMMAATVTMMTLSFWNQVSRMHQIMAVNGRYSRMRKPPDLVLLLWLRKIAVRAHVWR